MKTEPLDANTSSMHERGSQTLACQSSMENTDDAVPSNPDNANKDAVPSDSDNSALKDAMSSDPDADEELQKVEQGNSIQTPHKLLNMHFHSNFALLPNHHV